MHSDRLWNEENSLPRSPRGSAVSAPRILVIAAASIPGAVAAKTGDADCLWNHLPPAVQQASYSAYQRSGKDGLNEMPVTDAMVRKSLQLCGAGSGAAADVASVGGALVGAALKHAAAHSLALRGVNETRLSKAWLGLSKEDRAAIRQGVLSPAPEGLLNSARLFRALGGAAVRAGATMPKRGEPLADKRFKTYIDYFEGRAEAEEYERQF